jgi:sulfide:quinone oxidoreductase
LPTSGKVILILGAGFGGLSAANFLRKRLSPEHRILVIDKKDHFIMGLVNLWILNGDRTLEDSKSSLIKLKDKGIEFSNEEILKIDVFNTTVTTQHNHNIAYDYLIIALGTDFALERINRFREAGIERAFNLYDPEEVPKLREGILALRTGRIAICVSDIPYKCPPAPYEASFIIDDILLKQGTREAIEIDIYTPTPIALPVAGPKISQDVENLLSTHNINFHPLHKIKTLINKEEIAFENGNTTDFDILVLVPPHKIPRVVEFSTGLIDEGQHWINVDRFTLKTNHKNVYAIGDVTEIKVNQNVAIPKAGIFAEAEAKVVSLQIINEISNSGEAQDPRFDGKGFCFLETGNKKAGYLAADFYDEKGPITNLELVSEESYERKIEFERTRLKDWLA